MSFTVKYKEITMPHFNQSVKKVYQEHTFDDVKKAYTLKRLVEKIETEQKRFYEMYADIQKTFVVKDDEGKEMLDPEKQDEFRTKVEELGDTEITIEWHALNIDDLAGSKLTALDLTMLEPILDETSVASLQEPQQS